MTTLLLAGLGSTSHAQPSGQAVRLQGDPAAIATPYADTLHALVVFAMFRDDDEPGDPQMKAREWPLFEDPGTLPGFARGLLASSPTPPFPEASLTQYFHQQSQGRFVLYGTVYDSVLVSSQPEAAYHRPDGGYGYLTAELLDRIDAYGFDFSRFDHNRDGLLDYLFLVIRRDSERDAKRFTYTGISCLDALCGGGLTGGRPRPALHYDGLTVDWRRSGSILMHRTPGNIIPHFYHVRLMAHELGHDLWAPFFTHVPPLTDNDVPHSSNRGRGTDTAGYVLMAGAGGANDARGDELISAFERELLGWIDCDVLDAAQNRVVVGDLYTTADCAKIRLTGTHHGRVLYVTNRQRLGPFDRYRRGGRSGQFEMGLLRTTGLLVTLADGVRFDVLPADNSLALAVDNASYQGDLFGPTTARQLTPWTRPNTSGHTIYPPGFAPSWQALDRIRYLDAPGRPMAFDYVADFRQRPIIRADSWIGEESHGTVFDVPFVVTDSSTVRIATTLTVADRLRVEDGATLVVEAGGELLLPPGSVLDLDGTGTVIVEGELRLDGWIERDVEARLVRRNGGTIRVPSTR